MVASLGVRCEKVAASKGVNTEAEEAMVLEAISRQQLMKTKQTEKT
jgi:hypothetical protein